MSHISRQIILHVIDEQHPSSVGQLRDYLKLRGVEFTDQELLGFVNQLSSEGALILGNPKPGSFMSFLAEYDRALWIYVIIFLPLAESLLVLYGSQETVLVIFRLILGLGLLGFMPGYCAVRALFPQPSLTYLERIILSIFLSLIISITLGTLLGSVLLFETGTNVLLLSSITILLAVIAGYRTVNSSENQNREIVRKI